MSERTVQILYDQYYYSIDPQYPYLKAVFTILQGTVGVIPTLSVALRRVPGIEDAYLYGSLAKNEGDGSSDIDLLILGHPDSLKLAAQIAVLERTLKREVNYTVLKPSELKRRLEAQDPFLTDAWQGRKVELIRHEQDKTAANRSQADQAILRGRAETGFSRPEKSRNRL